MLFWTSVHTAAVVSAGIIIAFLFAHLFAFIILLSLSQFGPKDIDNWDDP